MKNLNIIHTDSATGWGGQQIRILDESRGMIDRGHSVTIICGEGTIIAEKAEKMGIPVFTVKMRGAFDTSGIRKIASFLRGFHPDIVNTHSSKDSWTASIGARIAGRSIIVRTRHHLAPIKPGFATKVLYHRLHDAVVTTGEAIRNYVITNAGVDPNKVRSIPTGIDLRKFDPESVSGSKFRADIGVTPDEPLVGTVGMLAPVKGHTFFVDAAALAIKKMPNAKFVIVGDTTTPTETKRQLLEKAEQLGISGSFIMPGYRSDVPEVMAALDIFALPSLSEGFPQVISQAMAMRKPVVASRVGGIPEQVVDGQTGILVEKENPEQLADAVIQLLADPTRARNMGESGRKRAEDLFSLNAMLTATEDFYYRLLNV